MSLYLAIWNTSTLVAILAFSFACTLYLRRKPRRSGLPLPPGPKKWPIIGNLLQLPTSFEWEVYAKWGETYGAYFDSALASSVILMYVLDVEFRIGYPSC